MFLCRPQLCWEGGREGTRADPLPQISALTLQTVAIFCVILQRCELCCGVWRGAAPALSLPDAASAPLAGVGMALGTGMGGGDGSGHRTMVTRPCQRTALGGTWPCPAWGLVAPRDLGGSWAAAEAPRVILGKISSQDISVTSVSPPGWEPWFLGGICQC